MKSAALRVVGAAEPVPVALYSVIRAGADRVHVAIVPGGRWALVIQGSAKARPWFVASSKDGEPIAEDAANGRAVDAAAGKEALRELLRMGKPNGPMFSGRLKGKWKGKAAWGDAAIRLELERDLTTYARIRVSSAESGYAWRIVPGRRKDAWFARIEGSGTAKTLGEAFKSALRACLDLTVGPSCTKRDTERRPS